MALSSSISLPLKLSSNFLVMINLDCLPDSVSFWEVKNGQFICTETNKKSKETLGIDLTGKEMIYSLNNIFSKSFSFPFQSSFACLVKEFLGKKPEDDQSMSFVKKIGDESRCYQIWLFLKRSCASIVWRDVTTQARIEKRLYHDALTGAYSRSYSDKFFTVSGPDLRGAAFLDMNGFKVINDRYGHLIGDRVLQRLAEVVIKVLGDIGKIIRWGGDEFLVYFDPGVSPQQINLRCNQLDQEIRTSFVLYEGKNIYFSAAIGVYCWEGSREQEDVINVVDRLAYVSKEKGEVVMFFECEKVTPIEIEEQVIKAVKNEDFQLVYQPIVDINADDPKIHSFEVLARMTLQSQAISPDIFIPIIEKSKGMCAFSRAVFKRAMKERLENKIQEQFALNISPSFADSPDFFQWLDRQALVPGEFSFELTESLAMPSAHEWAEAMKDRGHDISMDDFGSGNSNCLRLIKMSPIQFLKIDSSIIQELSSDRQAGVQVMQSIVDLTHALGFKVVIEGVETLEQLSMCRRLGADYGQGFFWSRPKPINEISHLKCQIVTHLAPQLLKK